MELGEAYSELGNDPSRNQRSVEYGSASLPKDVVMYDDPADASNQSEDDAR